MPGVERVGSGEHQQVGAALTNPLQHRLHRARPHAVGYDRDDGVLGVDHRERPVQQVGTENACAAR